MTRLSRLANLTNKHPYFLHLKDKFVKDCLKLGFEQTAVQNLANKGIMSLDIEVSLVFNISIIHPFNDLENYRVLNCNSSKRKRKT